MRQSGLASIAAMVAVGSGLLLDVATAALFGAGSDTDAFVAAARLPFALTAVLMVLSTQVLVPNFAVWSVQLTDRRSQHRLSTTVLGMCVGAGVAVALALYALAGPLLHVMAPGFSAVQHELAVELSRVMVVMIPLTAGSEVFRAWLNARHSYLIPAGMTLVLNVVAIAVLLVSGGEHVRWIAVAYVVGATVQFSFMFAVALVKGFRPARPVVRDPEVARIARMAVRPSLAAGLNPLVRMTEVFVASFLPAGALTIVHYGNRLVSAVGGTVLFRSVMVAILPRLARAFAADDRVWASNLTRLNVRVMAALALPLTTVGAVLAVPFTFAVFGRGEFSDEDAHLLGLTLSVYALSFLGSGLQRALLAPFYAVRNTKVPFTNTLWGGVANMALLPLLVLPFRGSDAGVIAIAAAYSTAQYVNVVHAQWRLVRSDLVDLRGVWRPLARSAVAAVLGGLAALGSIAAYSQVNAGWMVAAPATLVGAAGALVLATCVTLAVELTDPALRRSLRRSRPGRKGRTGGPSSRVEGQGATAAPVARQEPAPRR